jgi:hypothetical protein
VTFQDQVNEFANQLEQLVNGTICDDFAINVIDLGAKDEFRLVSYPKSSRPSHRAIPTEIVNSFSLHGEPLLGFQAIFVIVPDPRDRYLAVRKSIVSANHLPSGGIPLIRLEYNRDAGIEPGKANQRRHSRHAAHVQIHGESSTLNEVWAQTSLNTPKKLEELHIPVGGRRFRPTVEDFIEFLELESIIPKLKERGTEVLNENRNRWLDLQLKSAVRESPATAIQELIRLGYKVEQPKN